MLGLQVIALLISDVVGNDLDYISSGPTVPDFTTPRQCLDLLETLGVLGTAPQSVVQLLQAEAKQPEFTKDILGQGESDFEQVVQKNQPSFHCNNVQNVIIGSNEIALQAAARAAHEAGYGAFVLSSEVIGDADDVGAMFAQLAAYACRSLRCGRGADTELVAAEIELVRRGISKTTISGLRQVIEECAHNGRPICLLAAGETTVQVRGSGFGGRCQQMALSAAVTMDRLMCGDSDMEHEFSVAFLTAGTDGQDGPTDAAGAVVDPGLVGRAIRSGAGNPAEVAANNDSYTFLARFERGRNLLKTGLTGTNVMDLHIILIEQVKNTGSAM
jgi:glycerate 2-kinase